MVVREGKAVAPWTVSLCECVVRCFWCLLQTPAGPLFCSFSTPKCNFASSCCFSTRRRAWRCSCASSPRAPRSLEYGKMSAPGTRRRAKRAKTKKDNKNAERHQSNTPARVCLRIHIALFAVPAFGYIFCNWPFYWFDFRRNCGNFFTCIVSHSTIGVRMYRIHGKLNIWFFFSWILTTRQPIVIDLTSPSPVPAPQPNPSPSSQSSISSAPIISSSPLPSSSAPATESTSEPKNEVAFFFFRVESHHYSCNISCLTSLVLTRL